MKLGECGNFLSLKDGRDFNLSKVGSGKNTDYSGSSLSMKTSPVFTDPAKIQTLLENLKKMDYSQLVEFQTPEALKELLSEFFKEGSTEPAPKETTIAPDEASFEDKIYGVKQVETNKTEEIPDDIDDLLNSI